MKKIITTIAFVALSTVSAKALDLPTFSMPSLGMFSLTGGLSANQGVFGATAQETNQNGAGVDRSQKTEHGVFAEQFESQFVELGIGKWVSIGFDHVPDSISTPENVTRETNATEKGRVSVDFNDVNTQYVRVNLPLLNGMYLKYGEVTTDLDIKERMGSGSKYRNVETSGNSYGLGYNAFIKDTGFAFRIETSYMDLDDVSTDNGIAMGTVDATAGSKNHNRIDAKHLEGLQAKIAVAYTFGRNRD